MSLEASGSEAGPLLVIGVGHRYRRDDGVGPYVAAALAVRGLEALLHEGDGLGLLDLWQGRERCLVVDAIAGPAAAGEIRRMASDVAALRAAGFVHSSHRIGLPEAVALGQAFERMPRRLEVIGIVGRDFGFGEGLSPEVARAADRLIADLDEIR